jgi:predicted dehydrogenase
MKEHPVISRNVRIGIVGCGKITSTMHLPILANIPQVRVEYLADMDPPRALAADFGTCAIGIDDIASLPVCDIVFLATPVGVREPYIEEFGRRKVTVFSEKPFATNGAQHLRFLTLASSATCNYMRTTFSSIAQVKNMIATRLFGSLRSIVITEGRILGATGRSRTHYQMDASLSGGGVLIETGSHTLSQLTHLLDGYRFEAVTTKIKWLDGLDIDVQTNIRGSAESAVEVSYHVTLIRPVTNLMKLRFDSASVCFDHTDPTSRVRVATNDGDVEFFVVPDRTCPSTIVQAFFVKWVHILNAWADQVPIESARETSLVTTTLIESIYAADGRSTI